MTKNTSFNECGFDVKVGDTVLLMGNNVRAEALGVSADVITVVADLYGHTFVGVVSKSRLGHGVLGDGRKFWAAEEHVEMTDA